MLNVRAYEATKEYVLKKIRLAVGQELSERIDPLASYPPADYEVPASEDVEDYEDEEDFLELLRDNMVYDYLYALAICEEATGNADQALYTHRYAFKIMPDYRTAMGISRCIDTLGNAAKVKEQKKAIGKATNEAKLD